MAVPDLVDRLVPTAHGDIAPEIAMNSTTRSGVEIAYQVTGEGIPVTCFVPGITQTMADGRAFGSGVTGSRVFLDLRAHGRSSAPPGAADECWTYEALADDIAAVADETTASRALGVSLGAGALLALMARDPARFERAVLVLPAAINEARPAAMVDLYGRLADAVDADDAVALGRLLLEVQPPSVRGRIDVSLWAKRHAAQIGGTVASSTLRSFASQAPVPDTDRLADLAAEVLVLAQHGDPAHPAEVAERLVDLLPHAQLVISDEPWIWQARSRLRTEISNFLNPPPPPFHQERRVHPI